jgi:hypothetical protein
LRKESVLGEELIGEVPRTDVFLRELDGGVPLLVRQDLRGGREEVLAEEVIGELPKTDTLIRKKSYDYTPA